jgi:hypothetical protein
MFHTRYFSPLISFYFDSYRRNLAELCRADEERVTPGSTSWWWAPVDVSNMRRIWYIGCNMKKSKPPIKGISVGFYQTTDAGVTAQPFGNLFPLAFSLQQCMDIYGLQGPNVNFTNAYYGGKGIATSNTLFVNGLIDPWHILSVTTAENQPESVGVIVMESTAHCGSFFPLRVLSPF